MRATLLFIAILFLEFLQELHHVNIGPAFVLCGVLPILLLLDLYELFSRRSK